VCRCFPAAPDRSRSRTPEKKFAALAERLLNDLKIGAESVRELAAHPRGQIVVASVVSLAGAVLPGLIADYSRRFPGIELHLREGLHNMVMDEIRNGLADFGIGYVDDVPRSFVTEDLGVETFHLVMRRDHGLARRTRIALPALADVPLVSFPVESRTRHIVDRAAATAGLSFHYVTTTNRLPTLHGLVRNRVGLAVVPRSERPLPDDPDLTSSSLAGHGLSCRVGIMRLRDRELTAAAAQFLDVVRNWWRASRHGPGGRNRRYSSGSVVNSSG
jgi:DNA-binding transcriptional LysR family regulator